LSIGANKKKVYFYLATKKLKPISHSHPNSFYNKILKVSENFLNNII